MSPWCWHNRSITGQRHPLTSKSRVFAITAANNVFWAMYITCNRPSLCHRNNSRICPSQTCAISFILSHSDQITDRLVNRYSTDDNRRRHVAVQPLIYGTDMAWKATSQTGGLPWMPALADSATFWTTGHARVADGRIQPAQTKVRPRARWKVHVWRWAIRSVLLYVSHSHAHISPKPNFNQFSVHIHYGGGLVFLWWQCDTLLAFWFEYDITFFANIFIFIYQMLVYLYSDLC